MQDDGKPVKFVAYYPYNADMQDFNYPVSIADQSNGSTACDLLYGTASEPYVYDKESDTNIALKLLLPIGIIMPLIPSCTVILPVTLRTRPT